MLGELQHVITDFVKYCPVLQILIFIIINYSLNIMVVSEGSRALFYAHINEYTDTLHKDSKLQGVVEHSREAIVFG